jgi:hypothetical protein
MEKQQEKEECMEEHCSKCPYFVFYLDLMELVPDKKITRNTCEKQLTAIVKILKSA